MKFFFGLIPAYVSKVTSPQEATMVFGVANVTLGVGGIVGNFLGGWSHSLTGSFSGVYVAVAVLTVVLIGLTATLSNEKAPRVRPRYQKARVRPPETLQQLPT